MKEGYKGRNEGYQRWKKGRKEGRVLKKDIKEGRVPTKDRRMPRMKGREEGCQGRKKEGR